MQPVDSGLNLRRRRRRGNAPPNADTHAGPRPRGTRARARRRVGRWSVDERQGEAIDPAERLHVGGAVVEAGLRGLAGVEGHAKAHGQRVRIVVQIVAGPAVEQVVQVVLDAEVRPLGRVGRMLELRRSQQLLVPAGSAR